MLTPLDIENKRFSKQMMNGYNVGEVDDFLDELTLDYQKLYKENADLKEKLEDSVNNVTKYKSIESTLQNTLVMAQSTAEDIKKVAHQEAEQIIKNAEAGARSAITDLNQEILLKQKELDDMKKDFDVYKAKMESLLISQLELLKDTNRE